MARFNYRVSVLVAFMLFTALLWAMHKVSEHSLR